MNLLYVAGYHKLVKLKEEKQNYHQVMIYLHDESHSKYMLFHARNSKLDNIMHVIEVVMMHDDVNHTNHENRRWKSN
jgi:hypothetical protein